MILSVRCRSYDSNSWHHSYTHIGILKECGVDNKISKCPRYSKLSEKYPALFR
uniref:Uncharacterized protein n=1 Tax=Helianthus annuus TaxID=4232 RepID=A0A251RZJ2_HELAN